jgi:hypothetical protein
VSVFKGKLNFASLVPVDRGVIETNSLIYMPTKEDFKRLNDVNLEKEFWED